MQRAGVPLLTFPNFEESFSFVQALLANKALYVLTFGIFLSENPIVRTLAIVFAPVRSMNSPCLQAEARACQERERL